MRVRARVLKAAEQAKATAPKVNQLTDITVEEVSIVDRPANARTFLVIKSAAGTTAEPKTKTPERAPMKISPEEKAKLTQKMTAMNAAIAAMNTALEGAEESAGAALPDALAKTLADIGTLVSVSAAPVTPPTPPVTPPVTPPPVPKVDDEVSKAGRKLSGANQKKLETAMAALTDLFTDIGGVKDETVPETAATTKTVTPPTPPVTPPPANDATTDAAIKQLTETVSLLTKAVKTQKTLLDQVRNATPGSRQPNIEKADDDEKPEPEAFSWSMDMNAPHTKENTPVEKSFFD